MDPVLTRLDPAFPICWEDPDTLRVGFERPIARVVDPTAGMQRFVGALRRGVDAERLLHEARRVGATLTEARETFAQLRPALLAATTAGPPGETSMLTATICDGGRPVPALMHALRTTGHCRFIGEGATDGPAEIDLVVYVERYWEPLERAQRWLIDGLPHLLIRFTDGAVHVGPIVARHGRPCHTCVSLVRIQQDGATAALAAQLAGATVASERPETAVLAAAHAARFISAWRAGDPDAHRTRIVLPDSPALAVEAPRVELVEPHEECCCGSGPADPE
ncbi:hypothetical protein PQI23_10040 [Leucobacter sp. USCH14]|uniref:hypothetical protein n=1 Tax=Leucobacter sp. USCH14 TaxID=3024838 RepID=UPI0030A0C6B6